MPLWFAHRAAGHAVADTATVIPISHVRSSGTTQRNVPDIKDERLGAVHDNHGKVVRILRVVLHAEQRDQVLILERDR